MNQYKHQRMRLIDKAERLSIGRQCELVGVSRSSFYYQPVSESELNLELMRLIDEEYLLHPWLGVPRMTTWLRKDKGYRVNPKRIERLYRLMGLSAIGPKPNTSKRGKGSQHRIYKYLLRGLKVERCNQVWAMDITYIPVRVVTCIYVRSSISIAAMWWGLTEIDGMVPPKYPQRFLYLKLVKQPDRK